MIADLIEHDENDQIKCFLCSGTDEGTLGVIPIPDNHPMNKICPEIHLVVFNVCKQCAVKMVLSADIHARMIVAVAIIRHLEEKHNAKKQGDGKDTSGA